MSKAILIRASAVAALVLAGSVAYAQQTQISGLWYDNRGPTIDIPINGGFRTCAAPNGTGPGTLNCPRATIDGLSPAFSTFVQQANGGVGDDPGTPMGAHYRTTGASPWNETGAPFNNVRAAPLLPQGANAVAVGAPFTLPPMFMHKSAVPIAVGVPPSSLVQELKTSLSLNGPAERHPGDIDAFAVGTLTGTISNLPFMTVQTEPIKLVSTLASANQRKMLPNAWMSQPGRGARPTSIITNPPGSQENFTFQLSSMYENGSVQYIAGENGFGGLVTMLLSRGSGPGVGLGGHLYIPLGAVGPNTTPNQTLMGSIGKNSLIGDPEPGNPLPGGNPGRNFPVRGGQPAGPIFLGWNNFNPCPQNASLWTADCDTITVTGPRKTPNAGGLINLPPATSSNYGFPLTTGTVIVKRTGTQAGNPRTERISAAGTDYLTPSGNVRVLQMVSGGITKRISTSQFGTSFSGNTGLSGMSLTLPEPGETALLAGSLLLVAGLYRVRRRF